MRISDEIDALEVMGINSLVFLCATRLLAAWMVLPFMYIAAIGAGFLASYIAVVQQIGECPQEAFPDLLDVPEPTGSVLQPDQGHGDGRRSCSPALLLRLLGASRPVGVGTATANDGAQHRDGAPGGMVGTQIFWGSNPRAPHWRLARSHSTSRRRPYGSGRARARRTLLAQVRRLEEESAGLFCSAWPRKDSTLLPATPWRAGARRLTLGELRRCATSWSSRTAQAARRSRSAAVPRRGAGG